MTEIFDIINSAFPFNIPKEDVTGPSLHSHLAAEQRLEVRALFAKGDLTKVPVSLLKDALHTGIPSLPSHVGK